MLETKSGLFIPACEVAYIKDGIAYLYNGAIVEIVESNDMFKALKSVKFATFNS